MAALPRPSRMEIHADVRSLARRCAQWSNDGISRNNLLALLNPGDHS
jgi:hypothetical protein